MASLIPIFFAVPQYSFRGPHPRAQQLLFGQLQPQSMSAVAGLTQYLRYFRAAKGPLAQCLFGTDSPPRISAFGPFGVPLRGLTGRLCIKHGAPEAMIMPVFFGAISMNCPGIDQRRVRDCLPAYQCFAPPI